MPKSANQRTPPKVAKKTGGKGGERINTKEAHRGRAQKNQQRIKVELEKKERKHSNRGHSRAGGKIGLTEKRH